VSSTDGKWQIGVASAHQTFDNFDRPAKVGADFAAMPTSARDDSSDGGAGLSGGDGPSGDHPYLGKHPNYKNTPEGLWIDLDSSLATDYQESPFFLSERVVAQGSSPTTDIPGSEIIVGPSSDANYSGSVERCFVRQVISDGTNNVRVVMELGDVGLDKTHNALLTSAYKLGDPVMIRTLPLGWTTAADFSAATFGVRPIGRYANGSNLAFLEQTSAATGLPNIADRERRHGMELYLHKSGASANRYVQYIAPVNSFIPTVRRWRVTWDYRLQRASYGSAQSPYFVTAKAFLGLAAADGSLLFPIKTKSGTTETITTLDLDADGDNEVAKEVKSYGNADVSTTGDWASEEALVSHTPGDTDNAWSMSGSYQSYWHGQNRGNRWMVRFSLEQGLNTALNIDNLIFEHAHGTSGEANGFYEINDWPEVGSLSMQEVSTQRGSARLNNGAMKVSGKTVSRPRWKISAEFSNVDVSIYHDLLVLLEWQRQNYPLVLRPYGTPLPSPLVGVMSIDRWSPQTWSSDGLVSFTFNFEEI
jgi:hypothetical protein